MKAELPVQLIGVINVESQRVTFSVLSSSNVLAESSRAIELTKPLPGWVEVDPEHIWNTLCMTINEVINELNFKDITVECIKAISIINERDTILAWNSETNQPIYNAIHYTDSRTDSYIQDSISKDPNVFKYIEQTTGLRVISMFGGPKIKWLIENIENTKQLIARKTIKFGSLETWIAWKLTNGNLYVTDITNASRTLLMDLKTLEWSAQACKIFNVPISLLPTIKSNSEQYGIIQMTKLKGVMIGSILANNQAAFYGSNCKQFGQIMSRFGDSCTVTCNVGTEFINSSNGLITTIAYQIGNEPAVYALEGWTSIGGQITDWLKDKMKILSNEDDLNSLDIDVSDIYIVPAFNGLTTPYWRPDARGIICGMTHFTKKNHIIRAALESICFHTKDVCVALEKDIGVSPSLIIVDGKYSCYDNLLCYQADILGVDVVRMHATRIAIYGAAEAAAQSVNIKFESDLTPTFISKPTTTQDERNCRYFKWLKAIRRSCGWTRPPHTVQNKYEILNSNLLPTASLMAMMGMMVVADKY
ncbi:glycerol kinase-like [Adelges cooleyi]|uniref:glycerol kinase-like n=1 Tax=Adelges cooleyi TaxID=133065 RepID=UPI00217FC155|nr:glycerol kinase-like [Adelges cooleyi]